MVAEIQYCSHRANPRSKITECRDNAYGFCLGEHEVKTWFCWSHLIQCRTCGKLLCVTCTEKHACEQMEEVA